MEKGKRFRISLVLYAVLAVLIWITGGDAVVRTEYFQARMRDLEEAVLGMWVVFTVLHWRAEQWRHRKDSEGEEEVKDGPIQ